MPLMHHADGTICDRGPEVDCGRRSTAAAEATLVNTGPGHESSCQCSSCWEALQFLPPVIPSAERKP